MTILCVLVRDSCLHVIKYTNNKKKRREKIVEIFYTNMGSKEIKRRKSDTVIKREKGGRRCGTELAIQSLTPKEEGEKCREDRKR